MSQFFPTINAKPNRSSGVVLVVLLMVLVLLSALVVGLLQRAGTERANAASFRGGTLSGSLAEYAINVVKTQITTATTQDPALAWASQPGAIRTYSATGPGLQSIYKLYSAPALAVGSAAALSADTSALGGWQQNRALFVDLNSPVTANGRPHYPILDPEAVVQGFEIQGAPASNQNMAPMPVWWLYLLEDGSLVAPESASGDHSVTIPGASKDNPITGRIAFWTDDETAKININTASGAPWDFGSTTVTTNWGAALTTRTPGNFWDTPIVGSTQDVNLAISQPWSGEYQRYPGHPATVSLSAALPGLDTWQKIEAFTPRVADQTDGSFGSRWGSHFEPNTSGGPQNVFKLPDDGNRLYANIDEAFFAANDRPSGQQLASGEIERARFFITATSRAPDLTLFNTPRILNWPITTSKPLTAFDQLISFCGTVGPDISIGGPDSYYFTRQDPDSPTTDYNIPRNQTLLGYLRRMTTRAVPGFGGSAGILGKYAGGESEQILTEIFDFIRSTNSRQNLGDTSVADPTHMYAPEGSIFPTHGAGNTRGFGRFPTITKAGLVFWFDQETPPAPPPAPPAAPPADPSGPKTVDLCARLLLEAFIASQGNPDPESDNHRYVVSGLASLKWGVDEASAVPIFPEDEQVVGPWTRGLANTRVGGRRSITANTQEDRLRNTSSPAFPIDADNFYFSGGTITVRVTDASGAHENQKISILIPGLEEMPFPASTADSPLGSGDGQAAWTSSARRSSGDLRKVFRSEDTVRAVGVGHGDFRLVAANPDVPASVFKKVHGYDEPLQHLVHNFLGEYPYSFRNGTFPRWNYYDAADTAFVVLNGPDDSEGPRNTHLRWVGGDAVVPNTTAITGDFDNGYGNVGDGPYIGFPDEGNARVYVTSARHGVPYLDGSGEVFLPSAGYFSPNRLVPSPGIMGSLPTGILSQTPWQTLLFRPAALTSSTHPGLANPPDYLLLDLFNMPVVEPYAISEPLSTAGRVNMNYQIQPFTWIHRRTAIMAALHTEQILAINNSITKNSRYHADHTGKDARNSRFLLNLSRETGTLKGFEDRFEKGDLFRSAAEICTIPLVPEAPGATFATMASWWKDYSITGDNSRERPYARIYPKLTTKSNTFTVHYRVESLKKRRTGDQDLWVEGSDLVVSTLRGSATIERFVDPRDPGLPDYANLPTLPPTGPNALPNFYRWRTLAEKRFSP